LPRPCRWPSTLHPGDTIALAAPASPVSHAAWEKGMGLLQDGGFRVKHGPEIFHNRTWGADTDRRVAARFQELWLDPEVKAILAVRGGYGSLKILPHLNLKQLRRHPKRLLGFSDITNLLWHCHRRLGLVTFHAPTLAHLGELTPHAREDFFRWLASPGPQPLTYPDLMVLHPGTAEGPLAGGNLTTLCHLVGTPFAPKFRDYLVFLEDHNEALYRLDRMVHHLLLAGVLKGVKGMVLGSFTNCGSGEGVLEVMASALAPLGVPVLAGLPLGHQPDNHPLPLGAAARLDSPSASLRLLADRD